MQSVNFEKHFHFGDTWSLQNGIRGLDKFNGYKAEYELKRQRENAKRMQLEKDKAIRKRQAELNRFVFCLADKTYADRRTK